MVNTRASELTR